MAWLAGRLRRARAAREVPADEETAELTANYWRTYDARMASVGFRDVAQRFPGLVGQAVRLGWSASRLDTASTIGLNLVSGVFAGYALFATIGVLQALFAAGPTPHRVRAALPSLILVAAGDGGAIRPADRGGLGQSRLEPQVDQAVEVRLFDLTSQVELTAFDDPDFHDRMQRARDRGLYSAAQVVNNVINCMTAFVGIAAAATVVGVLQPDPARGAARRTAAGGVGRRPVGADQVRDPVRAHRQLPQEVHPDRADRPSGGPPPSSARSPCARSCSTGSRGWPRTRGTRSWPRPAVRRSPRWSPASWAGSPPPASTPALGGLLAAGALPLSVAGTAVLAHPVGAGVAAAAHVRGQPVLRGRAVLLRLPGVL